MTQCIATYDFLLDKAVFNDWQSEQYSESISEECKQAFKELLIRAIHNELCDTDITIIKLYYSKKYTQRQIADLLNLDVSTVSRRIKRATNILYEKLKYAAEYRFGLTISSATAGKRQETGLLSI